MGYETTVKHKIHGVNITNTTNLVPVRNPVPVPHACMLNTWSHNTRPSGWGTVPRADPTENTSAQEISVVTNPPAGQIVTFVPTIQQQIADRHYRGMCDNSDAIYNDSLSISHVSHHLNNIVYLQVEYTMDTAVKVTRDIYNCIDGHDVPYTYQGPIPVSCFTSKDILTSIVSRILVLKVVEQVT